MLKNLFKLLLFSLLLHNIACGDNKTESSVPKTSSEKKESLPETTANVAGVRPSIIGLVDNTEGSYLQGCGCYYWQPGVKNASPFKSDKSNLKAQYLFMHDMGLPGRSWIMLNGQLINLYFGEKSTFKDDKNIPHLIDTFYNGDTEVKLDAIKSSDAEDIIHYTGKISVKTSEGSEELAFEGQCGC